ncbi:hypothetical protein OS493_005774 [Desmophyllum pertusum]|uniref:Uncharacterized protein n=1 Tax=Desmophyllum pertusum TaxID=174260 RepID=A0A9W9YIL9_9CNID|nr:hypothetical protein OS493_005774 [Desmophyllum pertusum]
MLPVMSSQRKELESSSSPPASNVETFQGSDRPYPSSRKLRVTFLASEWGSNASVACQSSTRGTALTEQIGVTTKHVPGTVSSERQKKKNSSGDWYFKH